MIFITTYQIKPHLTKEEARELMAVFAKEGAGPGVKAHYVAVDGGKGVVISESDDVAGAYRSILNYTEWIEYDSKVMLTIEEAVPLLADAIA
jgi:F420-dependent methylenetetrahydromethanopterin dehydrogenase